MQLREKDAQQYLEEVRREEEVLVDVVQNFNIGVVYDALLQQASLLVILPTTPPIRPPSLNRRRTSKSCRRSCLLLRRSRTTP